MHRSTIGAMFLGVALAGGTLTAGAVPANAAVSVTACTHIHTDKWSTTSTGSWSHTVTNENKCGRDYDKWTVRISHSSTGAHSVTHTYKDEDYPHYQQSAVRDSWSRAGRHTHTVTITTG